MATYLTVYMQKKTGFVLQIGVGRDLGDMERGGVIATIKIYFKN